MGKWVRALRVIVLKVKGLNPKNPQTQQTKIKKSRVNNGRIRKNIQK